MITHFILFYNCKHLLSKFTSVPMIRTQSAFKMDAIRGESSLGSDSARADSVGIKGINLAELLAMLPRAEFVFGMMARVTRSTDLPSYPQG